VKVVIGLGNPGKDYQKTRHNIGFAVIGELETRMSGLGRRNRFKAEISEGALANQKLVLAKPQMYMNLSGIPVREIVHWYKIALDQLLIVYDDMDLPAGQLRLRGDGSAGGHNGMKSIISELGTNAFPRLRVGIGRGGGSSVAHVLSRFTAEELALMEESTLQAADAVEHWVRNGLVATMNIVNAPSVVAPVATGEEEQ